MANYELGPCQLYNNTDSEDLGKTMGGVTLNINEAYQTLNTDQDGDTPVDESITGTTVTAECNLADISHANLAFALKQSVVTTNGSMVEISTNSGTSLLDNSKEICIKPYKDGAATTTESEMILIPKAGIRANISMSYDSDTQRVIALTLTGYPDSSLTGLSNISGEPCAIFGASSTTSAVLGT